MKKKFTSAPIKISVQIVILLAILSLSFGSTGATIAHAVNCYTLTLVNNPVAGGTIGANPAPNCGAQYNEGTVVTLTGFPEPGYLFGAWQGAVTSIVNPTNVVMSANKTVTAVFMADQWQKAIDVSAPSSITVSTLLAAFEPVNEPDPFICDETNIRGGKATIWFKYTAPANSLISLDTLGSFQSEVNPNTGLVDQYDTYISVWTGTIDSNPGDGNPFLVACNDDNDATAAVSQLGFNAIAGTTYYIQVAQYRGLAGTTADPYYNGGTLNFHVGFGSDTEVYIGGGFQEAYTILPSKSERDSYPSVNNGPVRVFSANSVSSIAAERVIYTVNGVNTSFSEMMALPNSELDTSYWLPWYNNVDLNTQLRFGNVSGTPATVRVYIGGVQMTSGCTSIPSLPYPYVLAVGASVRVSCAGVNNGPVQVVSNVDIVAAERVIYTVNGVSTSFSEMMALPNSQLDTSYWLPWYNNVDLNTQLRFGNVSNAQATVRVYIGGVQMTSGCTSIPNLPYPYVLAVGASVRVSCAGVNNGPVQVVSDVDIVAAERVIYTVNGVSTSFSEMMALPNSLLDTTYHLPYYNNVDLDTQLRFGNVSGTQATVRVYIGGTEKTSGCTSIPSLPYPYVLAVGASVRVSCAGVNNGPVQIVSDVDIVAAERVIYKVNGINTSFSEMMALPNSLLDTSFWLPWYNHVDLDTQLRFAVP